MIRNIALMEATLDEIRAHPQDWNQWSWDHCFAGIVCRLEGLHRLPGGWRIGFSRGWLRVGTVPTLAARLLGLTPEEAEMLFWGNNTLLTLERMVANLSHAHPVDQGFRLVSVGLVSDDEVVHA